MGSDYDYSGLKTKTTNTTVDNRKRTIAVDVDTATFATKEDLRQIANRTTLHDHQLDHAMDNKMAALQSTINKDVADALDAAGSGNLVADNNNWGGTNILKYGSDILPKGTALQGSRLIRYKTDKLTKVYFNHNCSIEQTTAALKTFRRHAPIAGKGELSLVLSGTDSDMNNSSAKMLVVGPIDMDNSGFDSDKLALILVDASGQTADILFTSEMIPAELVEQLTGEAKDYLPGWYGPTEWECPILVDAGLGMGIPYLTTGVTESIKNIISCDPFLNKPIIKDVLISDKTKKSTVLPTTNINSILDQDNNYWHKNIPVEILVIEQALTMQTDEEGFIDISHGDSSGYSGITIERISECLKFNRLIKLDLLDMYTFEVTSYLCTPSTVSYAENGYITATFTNISNNSLNTLTLKQFTDDVDATVYWEGRTLNMPSVGGEIKLKWETVQLIK